VPASAQQPMGDEFIRFFIRLDDFFTEHSELL
jgi:hypothetical protein